MAICCRTLYLVLPLFGLRLRRRYFGWTACPPLVGDCFCLRSLVTIIVGGALVTWVFGLEVCKILGHPLLLFLQLWTWFIFAFRFFNVSWVFLLVFCSYFFFRRLLNGLLWLLRVGLFSFRQQLSFSSHGHDETACDSIKTYLVCHDRDSRCILFHHDMLCSFQALWWFW